MIEEFHSSIFRVSVIIGGCCVFQVSADKAQAYDTVVFAGPPPMKQRLWPRHCVQDTWGAELHKELKVQGPTNKQ
jgi:hypothetical protein